ncbi:MAG: hypothetical protein A2Z77_00655 [Chloroflexi bacterium RBG_13_51_36]|nr:MAG: hypothetical protein A2Z77_00655 [Chloroflexi bacterium RBG_13_51_36]
MGSFKSLFSDKALAEDIIKANEKTYWKVRSERLGEDEHFYLATTLLRRFEARKRLGQNPLSGITREYGLSPKDEKEMLSMITAAETRLFSVLDPPDSIRALALYIVYKEVPSEAHRYEEEYNRILGPIMKMEEDGAFANLYRKKNPNMARQMDELDRAE